jgi:hypothetical protein
VLCSRVSDGVAHWSLDNIRFPYEEQKIGGISEVDLRT